MAADCIMFSELWLLWQQLAPIGYNGENDATFFSTVFHPIFFILAGNNDMHESSENFEIRRDSANNCKVICR